jgi:anhydro-N-acetylmuramic acid kinase
MSGTSVDGLDVALCGISGSGRQTNIELVKFDTVAYGENTKLKSVLYSPKKIVDLEKFAC